MALVKCPNCGREVSDKAEICPGCGYQLIHYEEKKRICPECGTELEYNETVCPNCGCPCPARDDQEPEEKIQKVEVSRISVSRKVIMGIVFAAIAVAAVTGIVIGISKLSTKRKAEAEAEAYQENLNLAVSTMFLGGYSSERAASLIHDVWYNTIYEEDDITTDKYTKGDNGRFYDDFNTSLFVLFADSSFQSRMDYIESNTETVQDYMKELQNPPEGFTDAYDAAKDLYNAYIDITECATNPTGNLGSFTDTFNAADTEFSRCYKAMDMYVTDETEESDSYSSSAE